MVEGYILEGNDISTAREDQTQAEPESNPFSLLQKTPQVSYADQSLFDSESPPKRGRAAQAGMQGVTPAPDFFTTPVRQTPGNAVPKVKQAVV